MKNQRRKLNLTLLIGALLTITGCAASSRTQTIKNAGASEQANSRKAQIADNIELPRGFVDTDWDETIENPTNVVVSVTKNDALYFNGAVVAVERLGESVGARMKEKPPGAKILYVRADRAASYETLLRLFRAAQKLDADAKPERIRLVVYRAPFDGEPEERAKLVNFDIALDAERERRRVAQMPQIFGTKIKIPEATLDANQKLTLDGSPATASSDAPDSLGKRLATEIKSREDNGFLRPENNEVEKTVILRAAPALRYEDVLRIVHLIKTSGAQPIVLQID